VDRETIFHAYAVEAGAEDVELRLMPLLKQEVFNGVYTGGFFKAPASSRFHGCYEGGLFDHHEAVYIKLKELTEKLGFSWSLRSVFIVAFLHDMCKVDMYVKAGEGYSKNLTLSDTRHAEKSLDYIKQYIELTEEEELCIRFHMGAYVKEDWGAFAEAMHKYRTVLYTHTADNDAANVQGT